MIRIKRKKIDFIKTKTIKNNSNNEVNIFQLQKSYLSHFESSV